jgi:hypothetical protein
LLQQGVLPDRFSSGFKIGENTGKIIDTTVGMTTGAHAAQYQKLYNAAQAAGLNITGGKGEGGAYNPTVVYRQPNRYIDMRTGLANPSSTGASADAGYFINPGLLDILRQKSGFDPAVAAQTAHSAALGPGTDGNQYTNLGQGYVAPMGTPDPLPSPMAHGDPGATPPIIPPPGTGPASLPGYTMAGGQLQVSGGPSTAGSTNYATDRPASPGAGQQVAYGQQGNQMGVPKAQQARNQQGGAQGGGGGNPAFQNPGAMAEAQGAQGAPQNFLPMTAGYESGRRGAEDQLAAQLMAIGVSREQIPAYLAMMGARAGTDQTYATRSLNSNMADRGIYDSGIRPYLETRDVGIPYGRQAQDLALGAAGQYSDLAAQEGGAYLSYDQQLAELMLQRAAEVAQSMPLSVSQYSQNRRKSKSKKKKGKN